MTTIPSTLRLIGAITLLTAPAIYIETLRHTKNGPEDVWSCLLYGLFAVGWLCGLIGLRRLQAAGRGRASTWLMTVTTVTAGLAILQSFMDLLHVSKQSIPYLVTDVAWPLTMVLTFVISVCTLFAHTLPGWGRAALLYASASLPVTIVLGVLHITLPFEPFGPHTASGWALWGILLIVLGKRPSVTESPALAT